MRSVQKVANPNPATVVVSNAPFFAQPNLGLTAADDVPPGQTKEQDQLWVFGGEGGSDETGETIFLNDVWRVDLPLLPCCVKTGNCDTQHSLTADDVGSCLPSRDEWKNSTALPPQSGADWEGRAGHTVVVEPPGGINQNIQRLVLSGGHGKGGRIFDDVWTWGFQDPEEEDLFYECPKDDIYSCKWFRDYEPGQWYRVSRKVGVDIYDIGRTEEGNEVTVDNLESDVYYGPGHGTPGEEGAYMPTTPQQVSVCVCARREESERCCRLSRRFLLLASLVAVAFSSQYYFHAGSDISMLGVRIFLPEPDPRVAMEAQDPTRYPALSDQDIEEFRLLGINTIQDVIDADVVQIIRLRGFDYPGGNEALNVGDKVCDILAQARAIDAKCTVRHIQLYDMEHQLPKNVEPVFDPNAPIGADQNWQYRGGGKGTLNDANVWTKSNAHGKVYGQVTEEECDENCMIENWDGCYSMMVENADGDMEPATHVDVPGVGPVPIPSGIRDPASDLQEVKCRQNPGARTMAVAELFEQEVVVMGGKRNHANDYMQDVWVRDDFLPTASIKVKPTKLTSEARFMFATDRRACIFEYKIVDAEEKMDVLPWTLTTRTKGAEVMDLLDFNWPWGTGPGFGEYYFYLRAIDPAGNVGYQYQEENVYLWTWVDPLPLPWIIGGACAALFVMILAYMEYRRRKKKRAMERYAIKRMRRKFKGQAKGGDDKKADWRALAAEDGDGDKKKKKRRKKEKKKKKKGLKDRVKDKDKDKKKKKKKKKKDKKDKKDGKSKDKDKKSSKSKDKDKKKKSGKEADKDRKAQSKEKDYEKKKSGKEADKERKKQK